MPIYEYQCNECEHKLEVIQKISEDPLKECPECGDVSLRKLVSAVSFRLKGTGWYETDFKDKKPKSDAEKPSSDSDKKNKNGTKSSTGNTTSSSSSDKKTASSAD